jgi:hypothetical protein
MAIVYGRLSQYELDKQGNDPYIETGGRRYRIIELVVRHDGGANYQAKEVTAHEPEPSSPQMPEPALPVGIEDGVQVVREPVAREPEPEKVADESVEDDYEPPEFPRIVPPLNVWAREHGWVGTGRISKSVREAYEAEFGTKD